MTEGNGALHFAFTFSADGADTDGVADIALAGDSRGGFLSFGETFAAVVAQSDIGGTLQLSDPDADVTGPVDVTKLVFLSGPVVGNLDSPNVQFAPVLDAVDGPCAAGAFDGGDFSGAIFRADEGDVAVAAGEAATITKGGVAFVAGVPFAFFRSGSGSYTKWCTERYRRIGGHQLRPVSRDGSNGSRFN